MRPERWAWDPHPLPRWRFDSPSGAYRVRYAASSARGMLREVFDPDRHVGADALDRYVVELTGDVGVLDLRTDDTLDLLGLDDQVNTSRAPDVWATAQALGDLLWSHYTQRGRPVPAIAYRSRTTPQHNVNLAFFEHHTSGVSRVTPLREMSSLLEAAVTADGFTVEL